MTDRVVLVTGSRFWDDAWTLRHQLEKLVADAVDDGATRLIIRHGACYPRRSKDTHRIPARSADWLTHLWIARFGPEQPIEIVEQERPADWRAPCRPACGKTTRRGKVVDHRTPHGTCPAAGNYRNEAMVLEDPRPDLGLAFCRDNSNGTGHCVRTMRNFGILVDEIPYHPTPDNPTEASPR